MDFETRLTQLLAAAEAEDLLRSPRTYDSRDARVLDDGGLELVSFASNDYLGLAHHPELLQALATGAQLGGPGSSRVVVGTSQAHRDAESALADFVGLPAARLFPTAYGANLGLLGSLFADQDLILSDSLNHASLIDGCRLSRARVVVYQHGDLDHLSRLLREHRMSARIAAVVTETAFSMDGDIADVAHLHRIATEHDAALIVDEAHALGVMGPSGGGVCASVGIRPDVLIGGLGKAFGLAGGFLAGSASLARAVDNFVRTFVFSTAILPAIAHAVPTAVRLMRAAEYPRSVVRHHAEVLRQATRDRALGAPSAVIVPVLLGSSQDVLRASLALRARGFLVPAMRPPTVPAGQARLRITPTAEHTEAQVMGLCNALSDILD